MRSILTCARVTKLGGDLTLMNEARGKCGENGEGHSTAELYQLRPVLFLLPPPSDRNRNGPIAGTETALFGQDIYVWSDGELTR
jgi:hypothetical protein